MRQPEIHNFEGESQEGDTLDLVERKGVFWNLELLNKIIEASL